MKKTILLFLCACQLTVLAKDVVIFGNAASERQHAVRDTLTEIYHGGMGQTARRFLPRKTPSWEGGNVIFQMKVDAKQQNYFTVRCWGSEKDNTLVMLFIDGKQVGYRHLGDYDLLHRGNGEAPCPGRFYYYTLPLPLKYTQGKKVVSLELRSYGPMFDYGTTFDTYQKKMEGASNGYYKAYVDTNPCFVPDKKDWQYTSLVNDAPVRQEPGTETIRRLKDTVSKRLNDILNKKGQLGQQEIWMLADAYAVKWTPAYRNPEVVRKVVENIDGYYGKYLKNPKIVYTDGTVYNGDWMTTCMLALSIRSLWNEVKDSLDSSVQGVSRREAWSRLMTASLEYGTTHRRQYSNQSMIIDWAIYECNRALMLMAPSKALPEYQTLRYLYESLSLAPWLGKETPEGPEKPLGNDYWQMTAKGLTKELGFVGYYGEVLDWVIRIYESTGTPGVFDSGDSKIKAQLLKLFNARCNFRYPAVDNDGNRCFRAEAVVGWRDGNHYPGNVMYGDRGSSWDGTPLMTAATTLDRKAVGYAQQMLKDNQFFEMVAAKTKDAGNLRSLHGLLHIPDQYELIMAQPVSNEVLPMSEEKPDYVFSDEEDGVVAIKHGKEILYASLYWRARNAINYLAKVHYITPETERLANVRIEEKFEDSGMRYTRPDWVNLGFAPWREWYKGIHSAHAGEVLPIAKIPAGVPFKPGDENAYAGRADYYLMEYGAYTVAMNSSKNKTFELEVPKGTVINLTDGRRRVRTGKITVQPRTTIVLYKEK